MIVWGTRQISRAQVNMYIASAMKQLKGMGITAGTRVAICDETSVEYIILLWSLWRMKAVACPVNPRWPIKAIGAYTAKINTKYLLKSADIKRVVCFDARYDVTAGLDKDFDFEQEMTVIATSGSSGEPKLAVHTWGNHYYNALGAGQVIPLQVGDRWLLSLPLYHIAGIAIVVRCFLAGASIVIAQEDDLVQTITKRCVTHVSLVTTQMHRLMAKAEGQAALKALKYILLGGSAIPSSLIEKSVALGLNVYVSYGLTEMSSQVATGKAAGCVKVLPYRQLKISDKGEVLVKGEALFKGYIQTGRIQLPLTTEGWFKTGDLGRLDEHGCLTITGRCDNMFISGGENIQPEEIEKVLLSLDGIAEAIVVPKKDAEFGHRPVAFIKFHTQPIPTDVLIKHCAQFLPRFKIPTTFHPWPKELMEKGIKVSRLYFFKGFA